MEYELMNNIERHFRRNGYDIKQIEQDAYLAYKKRYKKEYSFQKCDKSVYIEVLYYKARLSAREKYDEFNEIVNQINNNGNHVISNLVINEDANITGGFFVDKYNEEELKKLLQIAEDEIDFLYEKYFNVHYAFTKAEIIW